MCSSIRAGGEYYALILFGTVGMMLMSSAIELVLIFIALEISSISTYILAGMRRRAAESAEASLKYFLLGSFATAFFLYGVAMIYGATGTTNIYNIANVLHTQQSTLAYLAVGLMFVGLGFKVASAPFHVWTPDVYEGSPAPVVALMSTGPKAAAFAVLLRVLFATGAPGWFWMVWVSAALSMTLGNIGALVQQNVKRLLAYSSIAHAGYLLVAFAAGQQVGISAAMFYTASYAAMNVGAFAVVSHFASAGEKYVTLDDYAGLGRRSPLLAAILTIFLLSLIGIPVTGGFFAKFYVFSAALQSNLVWLTIIGVINSAIAAYYYLRIIVYMYMRDEAQRSSRGSHPGGARDWIGDQPDRDHLSRRAARTSARIRNSRRAGLVEVGGILRASRLAFSIHQLSCHHEPPASVRDLLFPQHRSGATKSRFLASLVMTAPEGNCPLTNKTPHPKTGRRAAIDSEKLDNLDEDDHQREQHQRLDEGEAQNQRKLDCQAGQQGCAPWLRRRRHRLGPGPVRPVRRQWPCRIRRLWGPSWSPEQRRFRPARTLAWPSASWPPAKRVSVISFFIVFSL